MASFSKPEVVQLATIKDPSKCVKKKFLERFEQILTKK